MCGRFQNINFALDKLPPMPQLAAQLMALIQQPESSAEELGKLVSKDPAVAARVLKIANSSFYSMSRRVTSLQTAIVILGERTLKNLVLAASIRSLNRTSGKTEQLLWEDSMTCALGARHLARKLGGADPEEAFMAGLFRHIGLIVLNNQGTETSDLLIAAIRAKNSQMAELERSRFGATHAEIGAAVLEQWKLSEMLSLVALHHTDVALPEDSPATAVTLTAIVNIAGRYPSYFGIFGAKSERDLETLPGAQTLGIGLDHLQEIVSEFAAIFQENRSEFLS